MSSNTVNSIHHTDTPFVQHNKVDCEDRNITEEGEQDESDNPSKEVLRYFHLETEMNKMREAQ